MNSARALVAIRRLDGLVAQDTPVHRIDARVRLITTAAFVVIVVSFRAEALGAMLPLLLYPVAIAAAGRVPFSYLGRRLMLASPFVLGVALAGPFLSQVPAARLGSLIVSRGWLSAGSIVLRFVLTVTALLLLAATTGMVRLCGALERLRVPAVLVEQLYFTHRYLSVLLEEALRMDRARRLRSVGRRGLEMRNTVPLLAGLLGRALERARRIHRALVCRGYTGSLQPSPTVPLGRASVLHGLLWCGFFLLCRSADLTQALGRGVLWLTAWAAR